jgi:hypothetical protein
MLYMVQLCLTRAVFHLCFGVFWFLMAMITIFEYQDEGEYEIMFKFSLLVATIRKTFKNRKTLSLFMPNVSSCIEVICLT